MKYYHVFLLSLVFLLVACGGNSSSGNVDMGLSPVVTVGGRTLYKNDLNYIVPYGASSSDSATIVDAYIQSWVNNEIMYEKARKNMMDEGRINTLVEEYRRSLIVGSYEEQLLARMLASEDIEAEMQTYFKQNSTQFKLPENLIKGLYLKVPKGSSQLVNFQKWYKLGTDDAVNNIEKNSLKNASGYDYFYNRWVSFDDIVNNMPIDISNQEHYIESNKNIEVRDSSFVYLLNIKEYKLKGSPAPYEYVKEQIAEIIKERKRAEFLKQTQKELLERATAKGEIKFYNK